MKYFFPCDPFQTTRPLPGKVKLMAYISVVVLALLLLVIVVVFLTLFFTQHPSMVGEPAASF